MIVDAITCPHCGVITISKPLEGPAENVLTKCLACLKVDDHIKNGPQL